MNKEIAQYESAGWNVIKRNHLQTRMKNVDIERKNSAITVLTISPIPTQISRLLPPTCTRQRG